MAGVLAGLFGSGSGGAGLGALAGGGSGGGGFLEGLLPHDKLSGGWLSGTGSYRGGQDPNKMGINMGSILANNSMMSAPPGVVGPEDPFAGIGPSSVDGAGSMIDAQVAASDQAAAPTRGVSRGMTPVQSKDPFSVYEDGKPVEVLRGGPTGVGGILDALGASAGTFAHGIDQGIGALNDSALVSGFRGAMDTIGNSFVGDMGRGFSNGMAEYRGEDPMFPDGDPMADPASDMSIEELEAQVAEMYRKFDQEAAARGGV